MLKINNKYKGDLGNIKYSHAYGKSQFDGQSSGIGLKYVIEGSEDYLIGNQMFTVQSGEFILFRKDENYQVRTSNKSIHNFGMCIDLKLGNEKEFFLLEKNEVLFNVVFNCVAFIGLGNSLNNCSFFSDFKKIEHSGNHILRNIKKELLLFSSEIKNIQSSLSNQSKKIETQQFLINKLISTKNFIYKNYKTKLTLDQLASHSGISKYHFSRLFKSCFLQSPKELQIELRMLKAKELIEKDKFLLSDIAFDLGYSDLASFSNQFKNYFGQNPSNYF